MPVVLTATARVRDWKALRRVNRDRLVRLAREAGATRFRLYRNAHDAARVLIVAELPDEDSLRELACQVSAQVGALPGGGPTDECVWESIDFEGIG